MTKPKKFRKKPVVIEALKVPTLRLGDSIMRYLDESLMIADWCGGTSYMMVEDDEAYFSGAVIKGPHISIETLEGVVAAQPGDYIIKGVQGEFYPCKPDIFEETYGPA